MVENYNPTVHTSDELRHKCGVYQIRNLINGKLYVGSSLDLWRRESEHIKQLQKNIHCNRKLQNAFNKYGKNNFVFEIIEFCGEESQMAREQYWIDKLEAPTKGYNIAPKVNKPPAPSKKVICLETKEIFDSIIDANNKYKKGVSRCCRKINCVSAGLHWMYYDEYLQSSKEDIELVLNTTRKYSSHKIYCVELDKVYNSIKDARNELHVNNITAVLSGKQVVSGGYHFVTYDKYLTLSKDDLIKIKNTTSGHLNLPVKVLCVNDDIEFKSYTEAGKYYNIDRKTVQKSCQKNKPTQGGLTFKCI